MALSDPDSTPACEEQVAPPSTAERPVEAVEEEQCEGERDAQPEAPGVEDECFSPHLPDGIVKQIAGYLVNESASLLNLLAMAGVCKSWRLVASELSTGVCVPYDGFDNTFSSQSSVQRFRKLTAVQKEQVFVSGAKLFTGYSEATFSGDGVSDRLLVSVAESQSGPGLSRVKLSSSGSVTDVGLAALITKAKKITSLTLDDLAASKAIRGKFLPVLFGSCDELQTLHISNVPTLDWSACRRSAMLWADRCLSKLHLRMVNLDAEFGIIFTKLTQLKELEIDGPSANIVAACLSCPLLHRISYQVSCRTHLEEALRAMSQLRELKQLELIVRNFTLPAEQLRAIGSLPLTELRLDSFIYKQQPTLSRSSYSHVDNEGVKALVDSICTRWCTSNAGAAYWHSTCSACLTDTSDSEEMRPLKLSLCGATALTHDAVSALLRLPILTELDIGGCGRIIAMDKMRLVAKVRAGREMLESGRSPSIRSSRFPGLML